MDNQISVFGGTGFVGSKFVELTKQETFIEPRENRLPKNKDVLFLISTTHNYHVFDDVQKDVDTNLKILLETLNQFKEKHPGGTFNFVSSWFVYGDTTLPACEESPCNPKGFYSITKHCAEQLLISFCQTFKLNYRILRLCNVYGANDKGVSKKKNALQYLINELKANNPIKLYNQGQFYRDYMHVDDVARAIDSVLKNGELNRIYNIGSGEKTLFRDLIDIVIDITGSQSEIGDMKPPEFHKIVQVENFYMTTEPLKKLGFKPIIDLRSGIESLCN